MTWPARRAGGSAASAAETVRRIVEQIRFGSIEPSPQPREFVRPKRFFRAVGGRAYTGEWWFEEEQLLHLSYVPGSRTTRIATNVNSAKCDVQCSAGHREHHSSLPINSE